MDILSKFFSSQLHINIISTLISAGILLFLYLACYLTFRHKFDGYKARRRFRVRLFYTAFFLFIFVIAKIWVDGFTHILTVLSLVSAALVVTNKEIVMNVMGGVIIHWREVFSEGDYIQVQQYAGYVRILGPLYFKIFEVSSSSINQASGRMIKIPNGLVINNAVINYSRKTNFLQYHQTWILDPASDFEAAKNLVHTVASELLKEFYLNIKEYSPKWVEHRDRLLAKLVDFEVRTQVHVKQDKPSGVVIELSYYCYPIHYDEIDQAICIEILKQINAHGKVQLTYNS